VETDEIDVLASTVLGDFEQVENAKEAGGLGQRRRDVREADRFDGVNLDFAFFHAIAASDPDLETHPDADRAGDLAGADAFTETLGEVHGERITGPILRGAIWLGCSMLVRDIPSPGCGIPPLCDAVGESALWFGQA
jgi:hypothetical protein